MKFLIDNWVLILLVVISGAMLLWPVIQGKSAAGLTTQQAVQMINHEKAILLDVSDADQFAQGHAVGSKSAPLVELEKRLPELAKNKETPVIFICTSGARAGRALTTAKKLGYARAFAIHGGLTSWRKDLLPTEKS